MCHSQDDKTKLDRLVNTKGMLLSRLIFRARKSTRALILSLVISKQRCGSQEHHIINLNQDHHNHEEDQACIELGLNQIKFLLQAKGNTTEPQHRFFAGTVYITVRHVTFCSCGEKLGCSSESAVYQSDLCGSLALGKAHLMSVEQCCESR